MQDFPSSMQDFPSKVPVYTPVLASHLPTRMGLAQIRQLFVFFGVFFISLYVLRVVVGTLFFSGAGPGELELYFQLGAISLAWLGYRVVGGRLWRDLLGRPLEMSEWRRLIEIVVTQVSSAVSVAAALVLGWIFFAGAELVIPSGWWQGLRAQSYEFLGDSLVLLLWFAAVEWCRVQVWELLKGRVQEAVGVLICFEAYLIYSLLGSGELFGLGLPTQVGAGGDMSHGFAMLSLALALAVLSFFHFYVTHLSAPQRPFGLPKKGSLHNQAHAAREQVRNGFLKRVISKWSCVGTLVFLFGLQIGFHRFPSMLYLNWGPQGVGRLLSLGLSAPQIIALCVVIMASSLGIYSLYRRDKKSVFAL